MDRTPYPMAADTPRRRWPAAIGAVIVAATVTIPTPGTASPVDRPAAHTGVHVVPSPVATSGTGGWPCFMGRAGWNDAAYGPPPICGTTPARRLAARADCPPTPDVRYIGVPWVPPRRTGCASLDQWWRTLDR